MLNVQDVDLHYGAVQALRGVSLTARAGEVTCVLGRNGVGKTSLMRAIAGHHPISRGRIEWEGSDIGSLRRPRGFGAAFRWCRRGARSSRC